LRKNEVLKGEKQMKRKGFTLVELLVVIAIIALLMSILMPTLSMVRKMAQRAVCGANLSSLYKGLLTYAQANKDDYPRAGGRNSTWRPTSQWDAAREDTAFGETHPQGQPVGVYTSGRATIGASLYLLIREVDVGPKSFICTGDKAAMTFGLNQFPNRRKALLELKQAWDFGGPADMKTGLLVSQYYSYAFQIPYGSYTAGYSALSSASQPRLAVMADRSPYLVISPDASRPPYEFTPDRQKDPEKEKWGNSANHDSEGQNVLFNDGSVSFSFVPYCGVNNDNIYTMATTSRVESGSLPGIAATSSITGTTPMFNLGVSSQTGDDSVLVNEGSKQGGIVPK
jgi:prepilin-type N-terminal cleavage/methylation domain-containing protein